MFRKAHALTRTGRVRLGRPHRLNLRLRKARLGRLMLPWLLSPLALTRDARKGTLKMKHLQQYSR